MSKAVVDDDAAQVKICITFGKWNVLSNYNLYEYFLKMRVLEDASKVMRKQAFYMKNTMSNTSEGSKSMWLVLVL